MQCRSHGSRLLAFQRAHGITDARSLAPLPAASLPSSPAPHAPRGARPAPPPDRDALWVFPLLAVLVLTLVIGSIAFGDLTSITGAVAEAPAAEVSR